MSPFRISSAASLARRIGPTLGYASILCLLAPASALAALYAEPILVGEGQPFRLVLTGVADFFELPSGFEPTVEIEGQEIVIHLQVGALGLADPPGFYAFSIDMEPVPAGQYEIVVQAEQGDFTLIVNSDILFVGETYVSGLSPDIAVAGTPFELTVQGMAPAPGADEGPYLDDGVLVVPLSLDRSVITPPPPATPFEYVIEVPGLPAGHYPVVVGAPDFPLHQIWYRGQIEVVPDPPTLHDGMFEVAVHWEDFDGLTGVGLPAIPPSDDSALFWFFGPDNWELMVKVLDACDLNGHYWVLGAASTTVGYAVEIEGPEGATWSYTNPLGRPSEAFADIEAFECIASTPPDPEPPADLPLGDGFHELRIDSRQVVPGLPSRAVIRGISTCCGPPTLRRVERLGRTIRVHLEFGESGILSLTEYGLTADLGRLDEGTWELQVIGHNLGLPGELLELDRRTLNVAEHVGTRTVPQQATTGDVVQLFIEGLASCPSFELEAIVGRRITTLWSPGGCLSPPEFFEVELSLGELDAGNYEIEVRTFDDRRELRGGTTLTVLGAPVTVGEGRFTLDARWRDFDGGTGLGRPIGPPSADSALFWFFGPDNWELMVKVLDGCNINGHHWVLGAASTTVEYDLTITDGTSGAEWTFHNDLGTAAPAFADVTAFACEGESP